MQTYPHKDTSEITNVKIPEIAYAKNENPYDDCLSLSSWTNCITIMQQHKFKIPER
jgi:hypothetical protein